MADKKATSPVKGKKVRKRKKRVVGVDGKAFIQATFNNTIVTISETNGEVIAQSSCGAAGFKGSRKATPYASGKAATFAATKAKDMGMKQVEVYVKGIGSGRESAIRSIHATGLKVVSITDITPVPHNGCRPAKARRI
jgi:small subunit ribosomal protein S11